MKSDTSTEIASAATSIPVPAPTSKFIVPEVVTVPPPVKPDPAVTPTEVTVPVFVVNPLSLLKPDILIFAFVNFFSAPTESTTTKKSPSPSDVEVVSKFKSILAIGTVPLAKSEASKFVKLAPLIAGNVAGNLASGTVPLAKLEAFKEVKFAPLIAGRVAGNLASGTVPEDKFEAFKEDPSMNPLSLLNPEIAIFAFVNFF
jgi:hypothetical protein